LRRLKVVAQGSREKEGLGNPQIKLICKADCNLEVKCKFVISGDKSALGQLALSTELERS